jgi:hypothetical protein
MDDLSRSVGFALVEAEGGGRRRRGGLIFMAFLFDLYLAWPVYVLFYLTHLELKDRSKQYYYEIVVVAPALYILWQSYSAQLLYHSSSHMS